MRFNPLVLALSIRDNPKYSSRFNSKQNMGYLVLTGHQSVGRLLKMQDGLPALLTAVKLIIISQRTLIAIQKVEH